MISSNRETQNNPLLIVLSGPSGVGKDAVLAKMKSSGEKLAFIVTNTTRTQRPGEQQDKDYHFTSVEDFQKMLAEDELLEWANVYGNYYGVPKGPVRKALSKGADCIVKVDVQGAANIKKIVPEAVFIFLMPPSMEELTKRLTNRLTETPEALKRRLKAANAEIEKLSDFDYSVVNRQGRIDLAVKDIKTIIKAEKLRTKKRCIEL